MSHPKKLIVVQMNDNGCWICVSHCRDRDGLTRYHGGLMHRGIYEAAYGVTLDRKTTVFRECREGACLNPEHMTEGAHADNARDRSRKGRTAIREQNGRAKLTSDQVRYVKQCDLTSVKVAEELGVDPSLVRRIRRGETWKTVT